MWERTTKRAKGKDTSPEATPSPTHPPTPACSLQPSAATSPRPCSLGEGGRPPTPGEKNPAFPPLRAFPPEASCPGTGPSRGLLGVVGPGFTTAPQAPEPQGHAMALMCLLIKGPHTPPFPSLPRGLHLACPLPPQALLFCSGVEDQETALLFKQQP